MRLRQTGLPLLFFCTATLAPADEKPLLPALADSTATNIFAEYSCANFDLVLDRHWALTIFPKDAGARQGPPIRISGPQFKLYGARNQRDAPPTITGFTAAPPAKKQPDELNIAGKLSNAVMFGVKYKFRGASLQLSCWICNTPTAQEATPMQFEIDFEATHHFSPNVEMADRKKQLAGWYIKSREKDSDGKNFKSYAYAYGDKLHFRKEAQFLENFGPWGARKIRLNSVDSGAGFLHADKRGHPQYAYTGFKCFLQVPAAPGKKTDSATLVVTIE